MLLLGEFLVVILEKREPCAQVLGVSVVDKQHADDAFARVLWQAIGRAWEADQVSGGRANHQDADRRLLDDGRRVGAQQLRRQAGLVRSDDDQVGRPGDHLLGNQVMQPAARAIEQQRVDFNAGGFGLLHGMGFAGALAETGLPQDNLPLALLFFNVGIEVGQLAFILLVYALWLLVRKPLAPWQERLLPVPIYILGALSAMWCIERGLAVFA